MRTKGIKHVTRDDVYLYRDEHGRFCFAPSLIGESLGQLTAWNVMSLNEFRLRPVAGVVASAKWHRPVFVGETIVLESNIEHLDERVVQYQSTASVGSEQVFSVQGALGPLLPMEQFIGKEEVERQFKEIMRPGASADLAMSEDRIAVETIDLLPGSTESTNTSSLVSMTFDRIIQSTKGVSLLAEKRISRSALYFPDHFPNNPVLPMTILLECQLNLAHVFLKQAGFHAAYQIMEFQKIKMNDFVKPGDILYCEQKLLQEETNRLILRNRCEVDGKRVCVADIIVKI